MTSQVRDAEKYGYRSETSEDGTTLSCFIPQTADEYIAELEGRVLLLQNRIKGMTSA